MHISKRYVHIHSLFRDNMNDDPENFVYTFPFHIENVVNLRLHSIEMTPSWNLLSDTTDINHYNKGFTLWQTTDDSETQSSGSGTNIIFDKIVERTHDVRDVLTEILNYNGGEDFGSGSGSDLSFDLIGSGKTQRIRITNNSTANHENIVFNLENHCLNRAKSLGWALGFREMAYQIPQGGSIISEAPVMDKSNTFFYFCLHDFSNNEQDKHVVCLPGKALNARVLGKVQVYGTENCEIVSSNFHSEVNSLERLFQNRFNLQRIRVQLRDLFGELLNKNKMDYSFTLELDIINE